jgi:hypothetical protein
LLAPSPAAEGNRSRVGTTGCALPAPVFAHRSHDSHIRDVQVTLRDFELGMTKQDLNLADIKPTFEPARRALVSLMPRAA